MSLLQEFKEFAVKGNVVDMAVGVIIGAAFGKIVSSLVSDVVMPPLGLLIGGIDFTHFELLLREAEEKMPAVSIKYGVFLQSVFDFLIVAAAVFAAIKLINRLRRQEKAEKAEAKAEEKAEAKPPEPTKQELLLAEIRDLLRERVR